MRLSDQVIDAAFKKHGEIYGGQELWDIGYHVDCWRMAQSAFHDGLYEAFENLYHELRGRWQVFRSQNFKPMPVDVLWSRLSDLHPDIKNMRLSQMTEPRSEAVWQTLCAVADIKQNVDGPSVVAISKFLHFWNPRLFVIVDDGVMWNYVFNHRWLWSQIEDIKRELRVDDQRKPLFDSRLGYYLAILDWGSRVIRDNPRLTEMFAEYVESQAPSAKSLPLREYDGAALEWLLLGLVEVPPDGVRL